MFFSQISNTFVLLRSNGGEIEAPLFVRDGYVYAQFGKIHRQLLANHAVRGSHETWVKIAGDRAGDIETGSLFVKLKDPSVEQAVKLAMVA